MISMHQRLSTYHRFETEARGNLEMAYYILVIIILSVIKKLITSFSSNKTSRSWLTLAFCIFLTATKLPCKIKPTKNNNKLDQ